MFVNGGGFQTETLPGPKVTTPTQSGPRRGSRTKAQKHARPDQTGMIGPSLRATKATRLLSARTQSPRDTAKLAARGAKITPVPRTAAICPQRSAFGQGAR